MANKVLNLDVPGSWGNIQHVQLLYSKKNCGAPVDPIGEATIWGDKNSAKLIVVENPDDLVHNRILIERGCFKAQIEGKEHVFVIVQVVDEEESDDIDNIKRCQRQAELSRNEMRHLQGSLIPRFYVPNWEFIYLPWQKRQRIMDALFDLHRAGFMHNNVNRGHYGFPSDQRVALLSLGNVTCNHECRQRDRPEFASPEPQLSYGLCRALKLAGYEIRFWNEYLSSEQLAQYNLDKVAMHQKTSDPMSVVNSNLCIASTRRVLLSHDKTAQKAPTSSSSPFTPDSGKRSPVLVTQKDKKKVRQVNTKTPTKQTTHAKPTGGPRKRLHGTDDEPLTPFPAKRCNPNRSTRRQDPGSSYQRPDR
ncbi:hypothetical protein FISHEDRAFT_73157 [Fistulina hepatica ATCC 64428]|uniref:Protein kinase domain-containing protein n=1 Tax=Fistulina hepatica ATCC 64428 TaxID=1128425 RepID=A0A0D7AD57_9AGAR|nr:hypothetical protein FISHEDRAFT_73157 [Fistulina hepatica ATCC 64428]